MTTLYLDTEFNEWGGALISMALVPANHPSPVFYVAIGCNNPTPWVAEHVMPKIGSSLISYDHARSLLHSYLQIFHDTITIVADWPCDIKYFCEMLVSGPGEALSIPLIFKLVNIDCYPDNPHNALTDARALRDASARQ